ncbi:MAG: hypothetical protein U5L11_10025 [Arhodomonas sp.]|nr:hypothetical protein [Arhodomonas sp.]
MCGEHHPRAPWHDHRPLRRAACDQLARGFGLGGPWSLPEASGSRDWPRPLGLDAEALTRKLERRREREFVYIRRHVTPATGRRIMDLRIPGVSLQREYRRFYPTRRGQWPRRGLYQYR